MHAPSAGSCFGVRGIIEFFVAAGRPPRAPSWSAQQGAGPDTDIKLSELGSQNIIRLGYDAAFSPSMCQL